MLSIKEFCKKTGMGRTTYFRLTKEGLPFIKVKRKVFIIEDDAISWMKQHSKSYTNE